MVRYLTDMDRWLCGPCLRTSKQNSSSCECCGGSRDASEITGVVDNVPQISGLNLPLEQPQPEPMSQDLTLPSLQELFSANAVRVVEHIPARSRTLWATVLASELDRARTQNSQPAWTRLFMLAKCCLWVPDGARGGRKSRGAESIPAIRPLEKMAARVHRGALGVLPGTDKTFPTRETPPKITRRSSNGTCQAPRRGGPFWTCLRGSSE